jgi:hypothetical protein
MGGEGLGRWCLHDPPCSVNLLFQVLGGAILITNYIMQAPLARKIVTKIPDSRTFYLMNLNS